MLAIGAGSAAQNGTGGLTFPLGPVVCGCWRSWSRRRSSLIMVRHRCPASLGLRQRSASLRALPSAILFVVGPAGGWGHPDLGDSDDVQGGIQLAVAAAGEPVPVSAGAGDLDRGGTGVVGVTGA